MLSFNLTHVNNLSLLPINDSELLIQIAVLRNCDRKSNKKYVDMFLENFIRYIVLRLNGYVQLTVYLQNKIQQVLDSPNTKDIVYLMRYFQVTITVDQIIKDNIYFMSECTKYEITVL